MAFRYAGINLNRTENSSWDWSGKYQSYWNTLSQNTRNGRSPWQLACNFRINKCIRNDLFDGPESSQSDETRRTTVETPSVLPELWQWLTAWNAWIRIPGYNRLRFSGGRMLTVMNFWQKNSAATWKQLNIKHTCPRSMHYWQFPPPSGLSGIEIKWTLLTIIFKAR